jgi:hypothetical protein
MNFVLHGQGTDWGPGSSPYAFYGWGSGAGCGYGHPGHGLMLGDSLC